MEFLDYLDSDTNDRFDMSANKNVNYFFTDTRFFLLLKSLPKIFLRHSKLTESKVVLEELKDMDWQYLIKNLISSIEIKKSNYLKRLEKKETKIIKDMKENCKVIQRVYNSIYSSVTGQFKIYLDSLPESDKDETGKNFRANRNGILTIPESKSALHILDSFPMFYYLNVMLPTVTGYVSLPNGRKPEEVEGKKLNLTQLYVKF